MAKRKQDSLSIQEPTAPGYNSLQTIIKKSAPNTTENLERIKNLNGVFEILRTAYDVDIHDQDDVTEYLLKYPDLINFLSPMSERLRNTFGQEAQIILQMYFDPEIDYHYLTICLRFNDYSTNFMEKIESIHEGFDNQMIKISGRLLITTDFFPPQRIL